MAAANLLVGLTSKTWRRMSIPTCRLAAAAAAAAVAAAAAAVTLQVGIDISVAVFDVKPTCRFAAASAATAVPNRSPGNLRKIIDFRGIPGIQGIPRHPWGRRWLRIYGWE